MAHTVGNQTAVQAKLVTAKTLDTNQAILVIAFFDEDGTPLDIPAEIEAVAEALLSLTERVTELEGKQPDTGGGGE